jgi:hydroxyethylthiazole kinase-like sugar kinase family protein
MRSSPLTPRLRAKRQALTNTVSSKFVANVLLSAGAPPAIVDNPKEAGLFAGVAPDPLTGLISAHVHFSVAAELAEAVASRPGSFAAAFVEALDAVDEAALRSHAKIKPAVVIG